MQSSDRLDRIEGILDRVAESQARTEALAQQNAQAIAQHSAALDRTEALINSNARLIESNARAILAQRQDFREALEAEREESMSTEDVFERRLDQISEDVAVLRQTVESINDSLITITTFFREEIGRIWERIRAS